MQVLTLVLCWLLCNVGSERAGYIDHVPFHSIILPREELGTGLDSESAYQVASHRRVGEPDNGASDRLTCRNNAPFIIGGNATFDIQFGNPSPFPAPGIGNEA